MTLQRFEQLEKNEAYSSYQPELAFKKELNILRNDFYYQLIDSKATSLVDFIYKPLDVLSGDAYSARRINEHKTFYLLVDGMGKGLSASFTAVIMTTFINHLLDKMVKHNSFSLDALIQESMAYIQPILLDEEALAIDYICFDSYFKELKYAKFAMPPFLLQDKNDNIIKIKSNNTPMSKWQSSYTIDRKDVKNIDKYLFYSDGVVENQTNTQGLTYTAFIEEDFKFSFSREEFKEKFFAKITEQEDDLTLIFINSLDLREETLLEKKFFSTTLDAVEEANIWYEELWKNLQVDSKIAYRAGLVFSELFMNAYEHGNLGLDSRTKHRYLEEDIYFESLQKLEQESQKKISVQIFKLKELSSEYIVTKIADEGDGFDTQILSEIFRNSLKFNGRGVFVSRKNSMGIYYNPKGNCVIFLHKI
ncbi:SpoIIE family protein phosphatase [Sulfurimonas sp.]|uniref:ATP-binding SpoIIE family protein phosphatase n=1 Tax=Sulfurimonas sp. TaxID=2022749 RepID=UPI00260EC473|nr:SpoIIE family protein phosphatase [Sulfurimonas sp.]